MHICQFMAAQKSDFPPLVQTTASDFLRFLILPSREKKYKDLLLLMEKKNDTLFIFTQHKVNTVPHLL